MPSFVPLPSLLQKGGIRHIMPRLFWYRAQPGRKHFAHCRSILRGEHDGAREDQIHL